MVATAGLLLLQVPPGVASCRVLVSPMQIFRLPVIIPNGGCAYACAKRVKMNAKKRVRLFITIFLVQIQNY